jgi:ornithine carbamoyltransferase
MVRHYLTELDLDPTETRALLNDAAALKRSRKTGELGTTDLARKHVALYFEKPSVRTRISFTVAVHELGGQVVELEPSNTKVGKGEHVEDFARVVGRYAQVLVARVFAQSTLEAMAATAGVPVINALSDSCHPCQALADVMTIEERQGPIEGRRIAFIGEGNNVAVSLGLLATQFGAEVRVASPAGYGLPRPILERASRHRGRLVQMTDPVEAVRGADVLYTDTWVSMGQEAESRERRDKFAGFAITRALLAKADPTAIVMHCLPAVRGEEIELEVMHGQSSAIWDQAENRLHAQKALLRMLITNRR